MLTMDDITLTLGPEIDPNGMAIAFVIDNEVVHILLTYRRFYDLISSGYTVVEDAESPEGVFKLLFKSGEEVVETLECDELTSALLRSNPRVIVLVSEPRPPFEELGLKRYVTVGWTVTENDEFIPPAGWVDPSDRAPLTEEQKAKIREMGHNI